MNDLTKVNSKDLLKSIAMISMIIDHVIAYFIPELKDFRFLGEIAAPLYFLSAGLQNGKKIYFRYLVGGLSITLLKYFYRPEIHLNILVTFFVINLIAHIYFKVHSRWRSIIHFSFFGFCITQIYFNQYLEYGFIGFFLGSSFFLFKQKPKLAKSMASAGILLHMSSNIFFGSRTYSKLLGPETGYDYIIFSGFILNYLLCLFLCLTYQERTYNMNLKLNKALKFLSRQSFWIYISHYSLFILIKQTFLKR